MVFVDLRAKDGRFSLAMADAGFNVWALEPWERNLARVRDVVNQKNEESEECDESKA